MRMLQILSPAVRDRFCAALKDAGYTVEGVTALLGFLQAPQERDASFARTLYLTRRLAPLDVCIRLFLNSMPVEIGALERSLVSFPIGHLAEMGLIRLDGGFALPCVTVMPFEGLYIVFDIPAGIGDGAHEDHVMGISFSTLHVKNGMIRRPSRRTLDVGVGCGNLAFTAAPFSEEVHGVDCNPRAVNFARFGAWLNALDRVKI